MACGALTNVTYDLCQSNSIGGIRKLWMIDAENYLNATISTPSGLSSDMVTAISLASGKQFVEFTLKKNLSSFDQELQVNDSNTYVLQTLNIVLPKMEAAKQMAMNSLILAEAVAVVKDSNGLYWLVGSNTNPLTIDSGSGTTGVGRDDSNNYTVAMVAESNTFAYEIDPTLGATIEQNGGLVGE